MKKDIIITTENITSTLRKGLYFKIVLFLPYFHIHTQLFFFFSFSLK